MSRPVYTVEQFLTVLKDMYVNTPEGRYEKPFPRHEKVLWLLPLIYERGHQFQRMVAIETLFAQGMKTLRAIATGIHAADFERSPEFLTTVLALNTDIRFATRYDHETFGIDRFLLPGMLNHLTTGEAGRQMLRDRYHSQNEDDLFNILTGNVFVDAKTLMNLVEAIEIFVKE